MLCRRYFLRICAKRRFWRRPPQTKKLGRIFFAAGEKNICGGVLRQAKKKFLRVLYFFAEGEETLLSTLFVSPLHDKFAVISLGNAFGRSSVEEAVNQWIITPLQEPQLLHLCGLSHSSSSDDILREAAVEHGLGSSISDVCVLGVGKHI